MKEIKLSSSIKHEERTITVLEMRKPTVRDHIWLEHHEAALQREQKTLGPMEKDAVLYARLADVPKEVIFQLDLADMGKCRAFYLDCVRGSKPSDQQTETDSSSN